MLLAQLPWTSPFPSLDLSVPEASESICKEQLG